MGVFSEAGLPANIKNEGRMIELAGSPHRVIPGHDALQFQKFPTDGRVAQLKWARRNDLCGPGNQRKIKRLSVMNGDTV